MAEGGNGKKAHVWLDYLNAERQFQFSMAAQPDWQHARRLFFKAVNSTSDYPEMVFGQFVQFELELGTLESYDLAVQRVEQQRLRIQERNVILKGGNGENNEKT